MEVLELNGKEYVKASSIAKELGYTADYVGQLCRGEKVEAQLVGRSWYVNRESIEDHKSGRQRSNTKKTQAALKKDLKASERDAERVKIRAEAEPIASNHFYTRLAYDPAAKYTKDESELIPTLKKTPHRKSNTDIPVKLAGAKSVAVAKQGAEEYDFTPTDRPEIRFKGDLVVEEPDEAAQATKTEAPGPEKVPQSPEAPATRHLEVDGVRERNKTVDIEERETPEMVAKRFKSEIKITQPTQPDSSSNLQPSVTEQTEQPQGSVTPSGRTKQKQATAARPSTLGIILYVSAALLVAVITSVALVFLEQSMISGNGAQTSSLQFNFSSVQDFINR